MSEAATPVESYETLYGRLQVIVEQLEQGELPLDDSLRLYAEGLSLAEACQRLLDQAELRVQQLHQGDLEMEG